MPCPAMSGALPCTGSNIDGFVRVASILPLAARPMPPDTAAARSVMMSPNRLSVTITSNRPGIGDHVDRGRVDVLIGDLDVGIVPADLVDHPRPQRARVGQHVGLVYQRQMLAPLCRPRERVAGDALDAERGVQADLGGDLVRCADADRLRRCRCTGLRFPPARRRSRSAGCRPAGCRHPDTAVRGAD